VRYANAFELLVGVSTVESSDLAHRRVWLLAFDDKPWFSTRGLGGKLPGSLATVQGPAGQLPEL
jgi:hypothetical protein